MSNHDGKIGHGGHSESEVKRVRHGEDHAGGLHVLRVGGRADRCNPGVSLPAALAWRGTGPKRTLRAVARYAQHWNALSGTTGDWQASRDILLQHCTDIGRDPGEIEMSINLRYDPTAGPTALADQAAQWSEAGADTAIVILPAPHTPAPLAAIADALAPLRT